MKEKQCGGKAECLVTAVKTENFPLIFGEKQTPVQEWSSRAGVFV